MSENVKKHNSASYKGMFQVENSDIMRHTINSLVHVASTKTSDEYARTSMKNLLNQLIKDYDFLKYIKIKDAKYFENTFDAVSVMSHIDTVESQKVGKAIQSLVDILKKHLGKRAGYFFIQEFRDHLGDEYHLLIKNMGVDLRLSDLQEEFEGLDSEHFMIKDDVNANIAFIEKK